MATSVTLGHAFLAPTKPVLNGLDCFPLVYPSDFIKVQLERCYQVLNDIVTFSTPDRERITSKIDSDSSVHLQISDIFRVVF